jgi:hypothetical protein
MDEIAARLDTIEGLRVHAHPIGKITPPAAIVSYPDTLEFDKTYGRGMDQMSLPVVLVVGRAVDRAARDELAAYCKGAGERSIKAVLESGAYAALDTIRVVGIDFDVVAIAAIDYIAGVFTLDIGGQGDNPS